MNRRIRIRTGVIVAAALLLGACEGSSYISSRGDPPELQEGTLMSCFNPELFEVGAKYSVVYDANKAVPPFFDSGLMQVTETREVLGTAIFNGEDAIRVAVSVTLDTPGMEGLYGDDFIHEFEAYYAATVDDLDAGRIRYLGSNKELANPGVFEPYETADPPEILTFDLDEAGDAFEQQFTLTTQGQGGTRGKETVMIFDGVFADIENVTALLGATSIPGGGVIPAGPIDVCKVSGTGFEPVLYKPTGNDTAAHVLYAVDLGLPVYIEYVESDAGFSNPPTVRMRMKSAVINEVQVVPQS